MAEGASGLRAGQAFYELSLKDGKLTAGLAGWKRKMAAYGASFRSFGARLIGIGAAVRAPLAAAEAAFSEIGAAMARMSQKTGVSVEALSQLSFAAKQSGVDFDELGGAFKKLENKLGQAEQGNGEAIRSFAKLGLSIGQLKALSPDQQFEAIADRIARVRDPAQRAAAAIEIFGKNGTALLPLLRQGAGGIDALRAQADALGLTMSGQDAQAALTLNQTLGALWSTVKMGAFNIGAALAPALQNLAEAAATVFAEMSRWVKANRAVIVLVAKIAAGAVAAGAAIYALGGIMTLASKAISGLQLAFSLASSAASLLLSPIGLIVAAIGGLTAYALSVGGAFEEMAATFADAWTGIKDALSAGDLALAGKIALTALRIAFLEGMAAISKVAGDFIGAIAERIGAGDLAGAWNLMVDGMAAAWSGFATFISNIWHHIIEEIKNGIAVAKEAASALRDFAFGQKTTGRSLNMKQDADGKWRIAGPAHIYGQPEKSLDQQFKENAAEANKADDAANAFHAAKVAPFHAAVAAGAGALPAQIKAAQDELSGLKNDAAAEKAAAAGRNFAALGGKVQAGQDELAAVNFRSAGTFNARGAIGLGTAGPAERIARNTERQIGIQNAMLAALKAGAAAAAAGGGLVIPI